MRDEVFDFFGKKKNLARTYRSLDKILSRGEEYINARDKYLLRKHLKEVGWCYSNNRFNTDPPLEVIRENAYRILKQARYWEKTGEQKYFVDGDFYDMKNIKGLVAEIRKEGSRHFGRDDNVFMQGILMRPDYEFLSACQIGRIEKLKRRFERVVLPHKKGETFNPSIYGDFEQKALRRILLFVDNGMMGGSLRKGMSETLEKLKEVYFTDGGLDKLRNQLADYILEKELSVGMEIYNRLIDDLESFFKVQRSRTVES